MLSQDLAIIGRAKKDLGTPSNRRYFVNACKFFFLTSEADKKDPGSFVGICERNNLNAELLSKLAYRQLPAHAKQAVDVWVQSYRRPKHTIPSVGIINAVGISAMLWIGIWGIVRLVI